jgi:hypothetical protein
LEVTIKKKDPSKPQKPWLLEVRTKGVTLPNDMSAEKEFDAFDDAVAGARKAMLELDAMCRGEGVTRRDFFKIAIIEV